MFKMQDVTGCTTANAMRVWFAPNFVPVNHWCYLESSDRLENDSFRYHGDGMRWRQRSDDLNDAVTGMYSGPDRSCFDLVLPPDQPLLHYRFRVSGDWPMNVFRSRILGDGTEVYFLVNLDRRASFDASVAFAAQGPGEIWNAVDASVTSFDGRLSLPPSGSAFVVFPKDESRARPKTGASGSEVDLSSGWKILSFEGMNAPAAPLDLTGLVDWSQSSDEKLRYFAGRAVYEKEVEEIEGLRGARHAVLDLGDVREIANVTVNGKFAACLWEPPYRLELDPSVLRSSQPLRLRIEVVNTWPNRLIGDALARKNGAREDKGEVGWPKWVLENKTESGTGIYTWSNFGWAWKADSPLRPAGLLGPVKIFVR